MWLIFLRNFLSKICLFSVGNRFLCTYIGKLVSVIASGKCYH